MVISYSRRGYFNDHEAHFFILRELNASLPLLGIIFNILTYGPIGSFISDYAIMKPTLPSKTIA